MPCGHRGMSVEMTLSNYASAPAGSAASGFSSVAAGGVVFSAALAAGALVVLAGTAGHSPIGRWGRVVLLDRLVGLEIFLKSK